MAEKPCNLLKNGGGMITKEGTITLNNTVSGWSMNGNWIAKIGNIVFGAINLFSSNNTGTIPAGGSAMGTVPWKPRANCAVYLANCSNVTNGTFTIQSDGNIASPYGLSSYSGMRFMQSVQFAYLTDD